MSSPREKNNEYYALYNDFTETYTNLNQLAKEVYPATKRFVRDTEPEINQYMKKVSGGESRGGPRSFQLIVSCMSHFDDFTLMAGSLFGDVKTALQKSDELMNKIHSMNQGYEGENVKESNEVYMQLIPELTNLLDVLKGMPERADALERNMKQLENDWEKAKQKFI